MGHELIAHEAEGARGPEGCSVYGRLSGRSETELGAGFAGKHPENSSP